MDQRRVTTVKQLELLTEYMGEHNELAMGRLSHSKEGRVTAQRLYAQVCSIVNKEGPKRTPKEWAKVWNDLKSRVRMKLTATRRASAEAGKEIPVKLTAIEFLVADILERDRELRGLENPVRTPCKNSWLDEQTSSGDNYFSDPLPEAEMLDLEDIDSSIKDMSSDKYGRDSEYENTSSLEKEVNICLEEVQQNKGCHDCLAHKPEKKKCSDCIEYVEDKKTRPESNEDRRNEYFGQLIAEELKHVPACLRNTVFRHCLKLVDAFKNKHSSEDVIEVIFPQNR